MIFTVEEPAFSYFDFRTLLKRGRGAINGRVRRAWVGKSVHEFRFAKIRDSMGRPLKPDFGLNGNVQSFKLCHCDRRRNHSRHLSFRAKKIIRLRMIFTVEEPAFLS